jgi:hypothetical protein
MATKSRTSGKGKGRKRAAVPALADGAEPVTVPAVVDAPETAPEGHEKAPEPQDGPAPAQDPQSATEGTGSTTTGHTEGPATPPSEPDTSGDASPGPTPRRRRGSRKDQAPAHDQAPAVPDKEQVAGLLAALSEEDRAEVLAPYRPQPKPRTKKAKEPAECWCGCGNLTSGGRFCPGHDARLKSALLKAYRTDEGLTPEQQQVVDLLGWGKFLTPAPTKNKS